MFLKNLTVIHNGITIRSIDFQKGLNLIVDNTDKNKLDHSGNNIGKTTTLRLINYCLDGKASSIYSDQETKATNSHIKDYLSEVEVILTLSSDLNNPNAKKIVIRRNFKTHKQKVFEINGKSYKKDEYSSVLAEKLLSFKLSKPTFRQIISKNIRIDGRRVENIFKILDGSPSNEDYEALYLYWINATNINAAEQQEIARKLKTEKEFYNKLVSSESIESVTQALILINREINELNKEKDFFEKSASIKKNILLSNNLKEESREAKKILSQLSFRKQLIINSIDNLEGNKSSIDTRSIAALYSEAKKLVPDIQKSFEDTLKFHNAMQDEKIRYVKKSLPKVEEEISYLLEEIESLDRREKEVSEALNTHKDIKSYTDINLQLNAKYELRGQKEKLRQLIDTSKSNTDELEQKYNAFQDYIIKQKESIEKNISSLNAIFSPIVKQLTGESLYLVMQLVPNTKTDKENYQLQLKGLDNPGTGRKRTYMLAFDIACSVFDDKNNIPHLNFTLHDQLETVSSNQLNTLKQLVIDNNVQYVIPILKDAFSGADINDCTLLTLSEDDRFFKI